MSPLVRDFGSPMSETLTPISTQEHGEVFVLDDGK